MKPKYIPASKTASQRVVCPKCYLEHTQTVLLHKKDYIKMLHDPFERCRILNVEKICSQCSKEEHEK